MKPTYRLSYPTHEPGESLLFIECLICGAVSYSKKDILERYCGGCHQFHEVMMLALAASSRMDNPALISLDLVKRGVVPWIPANHPIDIDSFARAAAICDEPVARMMPSSPGMKPIVDAYGDLIGLEVVREERIQTRPPFWKRLVKTVGGYLIFTLWTLVLVGLALLALAGLLRVTG